MIIEFRVKNFRSFREEQKLSFVASNYDKTLPQNLIDLDLPGLEKTKLVKALALYGPNAGGKSNLLQALQFLNWLVVESATGQKPEAKLAATPFLLDGESLNEPTILELTFIVEEVRYELAVAVTKDHIVQERLVAYPKGKAQLWYERAWDESSQCYHYEEKDTASFKIDSETFLKTRPNALLLSTAAQWNNEKLTPIYRWFSNTLRFLALTADSHTITHETTARLIANHTNARKFVSKVMRCADIGVTDVHSVQETLDGDAGKLLGVMRNLFREAGAPSEFFPDKLWKVTFDHTGKNGQSFPIEWANESAGTKRFFSILGHWFGPLLLGEILCVDELETSLHPSLAVELLRMLFNDNEESKSQLLFTTHNPLLLDTDLLRRDQIWFADKNKEGESYLYPLTDYKPRPDESLTKGYLSGRYGAIPFIPHGLFPNGASNIDPVEMDHAD